MADKSETECIVELPPCKTTNEESIKATTIDGIKFVPSIFTGHNFTATIAEKLYSFRVLKMKQSLFIYIGECDGEIFDELAMAMPLQSATPFSTRNEIIGTTIFGPSALGYESLEMSKQFSKRLNKQIFISCNVLPDQMVRVQLSQRIIEEIQNVPDAF